MVIMGFDFKSLKDKIANSSPSPSKGQSKNVKGDLRCSSLHFWRAFRDREHFSLGYKEIRPSAGIGARRKNVLRGAGYAWTPGL